MESSMSKPFLAHSENACGKVDLLRDHLSRVSELASEYAQFLGLEAEAKVSGILHDIGKYGDLFQKRLEHKEKRIDHWSAGAYQALNSYRWGGVGPALIIDGHHIGLQHGSKDYLRGLDPERLSQVHPLGLKLSERDFKSILHRFHNDGLRLPELTTDQEPFFSTADNFCASAMLDLRMLYSAVVDADFIDTEAHFQASSDGNYYSRPIPPNLEPQMLLEILDEYLSQLSLSAIASKEIKNLRKEILNDCLEAALKPPGLFTLTAPTGSGKTLAMLAFALKHAAVNGLRRIITVIPYLSIIEQTCQEYRKVFSGALNNWENMIIEDHSMARIEGDVPSEKSDLDSENEQVRQNKILAQNWDAPIIVTTSVQFLESLFSNRSSSCRKLHRLAGSVILLDEVQTIPVNLAVPTLATISRLSERFGTTVVFSTATQPAFNHLDQRVKDLCINGWKPEEIVRNVPRMFNLARRVKISHSGNYDAQMTWHDIATEMVSAKQSMCIVNLKRHAIELFDRLRAIAPDETHFHLSTNMCPQHRKSTLSAVKSLLKSNGSCRLVATQCVEAGVDIDFPVVFRALGPLDSLSQAAGRCNRNGRSKWGKFKIFLPEDEAYPDGAYRQAAGVTKTVLNNYVDQDFDLNDPAIFQSYYTTLYQITNPDNKKLVDAIKAKDFVDTCRLYKLIPNMTVNVLTSYDSAKYEELAEEARVRGLSSKWISRAQSIAVSIYRPRPDDAIWMFLDKISVGRNAFSENWFVYLAVDHYRNDIGLSPPQSTECLIA